MVLFKSLDIQVYLQLAANSATTNAGQSTEEPVTTSGAVKAWKVGDKCLAVWSEDSQW